MLNELYQNLDPIAFSIGPVSVRWYGIAYVVGFLFVALFISRVSKRWRIRVDADAVLTIVMCIMVGVIAGARLGYCLFYGDGFYLTHPLQILMVTEGGMSFHGGLIGALASAIPASRFTGVPVLTLADLGACAAPVGLFLGRCANFINGELWGAPTDLPWGVVFGGAAGTVARHPSQLYEALFEGIVLFVVLFILSRKIPPRPQGTFLGVFLVMYGCIRFLIELIRQPDAQLGYLLDGWFTMGQLLSAPLMLAGAFLLYWAFKTKRPQRGMRKTTQ